MGLAEFLLSWAPKAKVCLRQGLRGVFPKLNQKENPYQIEQVGCTDFSRPTLSTGSVTYIEIIGQSKLQVQIMRKWLHHFANNTDKGRVEN